VRGVRYGVDERRLEPRTNEVGSGELGFDVYSCVYIYILHITRSFRWASTTERLALA
jgi:hypothetical protein